MYLSKRLIDDEFRTERGGFTSALQKSLATIVKDKKGVDIDFKKGGWLYRIDRMCIKITDDEFNFIKGNASKYKKRQKKRLLHSKEIIIDVLKEYKGVFLDDEVFAEMVEDIMKLD